MHLTLIDLFCGCGGISWGFQEEGFKILLGADINKHALKTFSANFPAAIALESDLSELAPNKLLTIAGIRPGELDVLVGGPPCQGFSKNVRASQRQRDDVRNHLVIRYLDFVKAVRPKIVLMENVAEMATAYDESYTDLLYSTLTELGYKISHERLLAAQYGVPQLRRRAFFFATRLNTEVCFPTPRFVDPRKSAGRTFNRKQFISVWDALGDLPTITNGMDETPCAYTKPAETEYQHLMRFGSENLLDHVPRFLKEKQYARVKALEPGKGGGCNELPQELRPKSGYSGAYARLYPDQPARTITKWVFHPGSGRYFHPYNNRIITTREAARLQSFPDRFLFEGTYIQKAHQIGEAVPPLLAQGFAREAKEMLGDDGAYAASRSIKAERGIRSQCSLNL